MEEYYKKGFFWSIQNLGKFGTSVPRELTAAFTTFITMSYIIIVNPAILGSAPGMEQNFAGFLTATILVCSISTILMGLYANIPFALAPGMGINAFFAITLIQIKGLSLETALAAVFISGLIFILLSILKIRDAIVAAIPGSLRKAIAAGIGLFIAFIGFKNGGFIVDHPATLIGLGSFGPPMLYFIAALVIMIVLLSFRIKGALLLGIVSASFLALPYGRFIFPSHDAIIEMAGPILTKPDFHSVFFKLDIKSVFSVALIVPVFTLLFTDLFDSLATFIGISQAANMVDGKGQPINVGRALLVDAVSTTISGLFGTSSGTTYIESAAGVEEGGRTGLVAVFAGLMFLPFLFFSNLIKAVPAFATAAALVIVGVYMMQGVREIDFRNPEEGIPCFLAVILIPLTYSISQGIIWGFLVYTLIKIVKGKFKEVHPMMYAISALSILALIYH